MPVILMNLDIRIIMSRRLLLVLMRFRIFVILLVIGNK